MLVQEKQLERADDVYLSAFFEQLPSLSMFSPDELKEIETSYEAFSEDSLQYKNHQDKECRALNV